MIPVFPHDLCKSDPLRLKLSNHCEASQAQALVLQHRKTTNRFTPIRKLVDFSVITTTSDLQSRTLPCPLTRMGPSSKQPQPDPRTPHQSPDCKPTPTIAPFQHPRWRHESSSRKSISASKRSPRAWQISRPSTIRSSSQRTLLKRRSKKIISSVRSRSCKGFEIRSRHGRPAMTSRIRGRCSSIEN